MARATTKKPDATPDGDSTSRRQQIVQTYRMTKTSDTRIGLYLFLAFLLGAAVGFTVFWLLPPSGGWLDFVVAGVGALMVGLLCTLLLFSRRAQNAAYTQMEGRPGAGGAALQMLRRGWKTDMAVAFTKQQDVIHRVVGRPGVILVAEGNPHRLRALLNNERRKYERVVADAPVHEIFMGNGEGQVPLPKLVKHVQKLPRGLKPAEITDVLQRIKAIDAQRSNIPLPKGPVPTSMKGMRGQMRGR